MMTIAAIIYLVAGPIIWFISGAIFSVWVMKQFTVVERDDNEGE